MFVFILLIFLYSVKLFIFNVMDDLLNKTQSISSNERERERERHHIYHKSMIEKVRHINSRFIFFRLLRKQTKNRIFVI